ncbi:DDE superfamily endonuclease [Paraburkholderia susongensis]|uniref:DDE superfamily endonuclease n=1 Tax=Paraburkholderia susongensis TaxID=1515439 RepID=A0A1X7M6Q3_9BURK|nr:DDE superfamily endonuclease [Paraburkholderia susongensis]
MDLSNGRYQIIEDTGFPKKGKHSADVVRQYCGQLGKQDNYRVAVSLSVAAGEARQSGTPSGVMLADAGYGNDTAFRDASGELGLQYGCGHPVEHPCVATGRCPTACRTINKQGR